MLLLVMMSAAGSRGAAAIDFVTATELNKVKCHLMLNRGCVVLHSCHRCQSIYCSYNSFNSSGKAFHKVWESDFIYIYIFLTILPEVRF